MFYKNHKANLCIAYLHTSGHILTGYLDDSLLLAVEYNGCVKTIPDTISTFDKLGVTPTQKITYLGFIINSKEMTVRLTLFSGVLHASKRREIGDKMIRVNNPCLIIQVINLRIYVCFTTFYFSLK